MTAPLRGAPRLSSLPASQNTAPVGEFRCLFTHDVRRKQKRWQDGYLKFHTFNSRVMVYDQSRNFLGDTYWKESNELQEGDELTLDKGVMVEVADAMGVTQTDLTPLFDKKTKEPPRRNMAAPLQRPPPKPPAPANNTLRTVSQTRHKSLNALLGTPKGPIGKAQPMRSPFEERREKENQCAEERPSKRPKTTNKAAAEQRTTSPRFERTLVPKPQNEPPPRWERTLDSRGLRAPMPLPRDVTVINLDSEPDNIFSDVTLPSTPPGRDKHVARPYTTTPTPLTTQELPKHPQAQATPRIPKGKVPVPHVKAQETPRPRPQPSSPPVSASNRLANVDFALQPLKESRNEHSPSKSPPRKAKALRLSTGVQRGKLLCQAVPQRRKDFLVHPKRTSEPKNSPRKSIQEESASLFLDDDHELPQMMPMNLGKAPNKAKKHRGPEKSDKSALPTGSGKAPSPSPSFDAFDDMEIIHGLMDQQLVVTPSPPRLREPTRPMSPTPQEPLHQNSAPAKKATGKKKRLQEDTVSGEPTSKQRKVEEVATEEAGERPCERKEEAEKVQPGYAASAVATPVPSLSVQRLVHECSPPIEVVGERSRNTSTSLSLVKLAALSTGGFRKKSRRAQPQPAAAGPDALPPRPVTVALPPHPLRANKSGALMSTTELSAVLQKSTKTTRIEDDPIEDGTQNTSPNRNFRRSRSENDVPIPSTSAAWEQQNLPTGSKSSNGALDKTDAFKVTAQQSKGGLAALVKKTDPRRKFKRTQSLNVNTDVAGFEDSEVLTPPADDDIGPWSTEAYDLFDWRPPANADEDQRVGLLVEKR